MGQGCRHTVFSLHLHGRMPYRREAPNACTLTIRAQIEDLCTVDFHRHDRPLQIAVLASSYSVGALPQLQPYSHLGGYKFRWHSSPCAVL